jgi:hypothetical protein
MPPAANTAARAIVTFSRYRSDRPIDREYGSTTPSCGEHTELKWFSVSEIRGFADIVDPDYVSFAELAMTDKAT